MENIEKQPAAGKSIERIDILLLALIVLSLVSVNVYCIMADRSPLTFDPISFFRGAFYCSQGITEFGSLKPCVNVFFEGDLRPPLVKLTGAVPMLAFSKLRDPHIVVLSVQFYYILLLTSVFFVARRVLPETPRMLPFLAVFITGTSPGIFGLSRMIMADLPLTAVVWVSIWALLWAYPYEKLSRCALLGFLFACGMLVKQTFALFILIPCVAAAVKLFIDKKATKNMVPAIAVFAAVLLVLTLPWYGKHFLRGWQTYSVRGDDLPSSWRELFRFKYIPMIWNEHLGWIFGGLTVLGLLNLVFDVKKRQRTAVYLSFILLPIFFFGAARVTLSRYTLPIAPVFSFILLDGLLCPGNIEGMVKLKLLISKIPLFGSIYVFLRRLVSEPSERSRSAAIVALVIVAGLFQFLFITFSSRPWQEKEPIPERIVGFPEYKFFLSSCHRGFNRINLRGIDEYQIYLLMLFLSEYKFEPMRIVFIGDGDFDAVSEKIPMLCNYFPQHEKCDILRYRKEKSGIIPAEDWKKITEWANYFVIRSWDWVEFDDNLKAFTESADRNDWKYEHLISKEGRVFVFWKKNVGAVAGEPTGASFTKIDSGRAYSNLWVRILPIR